MTDTLTHPAEIEADIDSLPGQLRTGAATCETVTFVVSAQYALHLARRLDEAKEAEKGRAFERAMRDLAAASMAAANILYDEAERHLRFMRWASAVALIFYAVLVLVLSGVLG